MSSHRSSQVGNPRRDVIMSKLLDHVAGELRRKGLQPDGATMDAARRLLEQRWEANGTLGGNDVAKVVAQVVSSGGKRAVSSLGDSSFSADLRNNAGEKNSAAETSTSIARDVSRNTPQDASSRPAAGGNGGGTLQPLVTTSKRQRRMLADDEWAKAAEEDRKAAAVGRKMDRVHHIEHVSHQRSLLDEQLDEHRRQQEADRLERKRLQDEMTRLIEANREATRREQQEAHDRATKEKEFRERQHREHEEAREQARIAEHNEQVRQALLAQQELQRQREADRQRKIRELEEWKRTLQENEQRMEEKKRMKDEERAEGRRYMKLYADQLDQQDRERAEAKARKAARAEYFRKLADGVASQYKAKADNHDAKIEAEYQQQLAATLADEAARKERNRKREEETHATLRMQMQLKKDEEEREREDARRRAQAMREQEELAKRQEEMRRQAQRAEAARLNEFLNTQLQLLHYKETKPLETSIARPLSRAKTMFSPTRYRPASNSPTLPTTAVPPH